MSVPVSKSHLLTHKMGIISTSLGYLNSKFYVQNHLAKCLVQSKNMTCDGMFLIMIVIIIEEIDQVAQASHT